MSSSSDVPAEEKDDLRNALKDGKGKAGLSKDTSCMLSSHETAATLQSSRIRANTAPAYVASQNEDDEELRMAKALALAIASNPHLLPEEIRELVGAPKSVISSKSEKNQSQVSNRLTTMFQDFDNLIKSSAAATLAPSSAPSMTSIRENLRKYVNTSTTEASAADPNSGLEALSMTTKPAPASFSQPSVFAATGQVRGVTINRDSHGSAAPLASAPSSSVRARLPFRKSSPRSPPTDPDAAGGNPTSAFTPLPESPLNQSSPSEDTATECEAANCDPATSPIPPSVGPGVAPSTVLNLIPTSIRSAVGNSTGGLYKSGRKNMPIRLSTLAWKRRGGMGKYSTLAWELRRIELAGTRIIYYRNDADEDADVTSRSGAGLESQPPSTEDLSPEAVVLSRRSNWLEQAAATWVTQNGTDPTSPRGYIDLAKEKATVNAAFGHSGAPSPFALSIKVRGETKWKLCFDHHKTQMEWLVAITDVVVQASVDSYNASLLAAADPSNTINSESSALFFNPPSNPPPSGNSSDQLTHRLWMMDQYSLEGRAAAKSSDSDGEAIGFEIDETASNHDAGRLEVTSHALNIQRAVEVTASAQQCVAREAAMKEAATTLCIPEHSLVYVSVLATLSMFFARSSSTSLEGFWFLVVVVNLGLMHMSFRQPKWESLLEQVGTLPSGSGTREASLSPLSRVNTMKMKRKEVGVAVVVSPETDKAGFVPSAGSTTIKLQQPSDPPVNSKNQVFAGWCTPPPEIMLVRSHGYLTTKEKVPSPGELYECVNVDIFESAVRYPDIGSRVQLPEVVFADHGSKTWRMPDVFIVSIALPTDPPKFGRASSDGGGYTVTMYFRMHDETREILRRVTADDYDPTSDVPEKQQGSKVNAVRLMEEWCRRAPVDPKYQARFKVVPNAHNLDEIGMPNWIAKYNGKPFLVKRAGQTGFLYSHPERSYMEFDISLHPFPYLAKQAICFMKETYFKRILVSFGFCIEGRADDEVR